MTALGWTALAVAVLVVGVPSALPARMGALAEARRVRAAAGRGPASAVRWPRVATIGAVLAVAAVAMVGGPVIAAAAALGFGVVAVLGRDVSAARTAQQRHTELLLAVRLLIAELDSGARPATALRAAADLAPSYADVLGGAARAAHAGDDASQALLACPETRPVAVAWQVAEQSGAALGGVLAHIARDLARVDDQRRAVAVALSGPRASAAVLTGLPVVGIGLGAAMGAQPLPVLLGSGAGRVVCALGVALDAAGVLWIRRIVRRAQAVP